MSAVSHTWVLSKASNLVFHRANFVRSLKRGSVEPGGGVGARLRCLTTSAAGGFSGLFSSFSGSDGLMSESQSSRGESDVSKTHYAGVRKRGFMFLKAMEMCFDANTTSLC